MWKIILGAAIAALFGILTKWMSSHRDDANARCDEFIEVLTKAADCATAYRLNPENSIEERVRHIQLIGFQERLTLLSQLVFSIFDPLDLELLSDDLLQFFDACTGGDAGQANRVIDTERAREAQSAASRLAVRIRSAHSESVRLRAYLWRILTLQL